MTKVKVLGRMGRCELQFLHIVKVKKAAYLGHLLRKYELAQLIVEETLKAK